MANLSAAVAQKPSINSETSEIFIKQTSPTLVDFPNKPVEYPEWRLKLQNAVRTRQENSEQKPLTNISSKRRTVNLKGSNNQSVDVYERVETKKAVNPTLERALQRIEQSKNRYTNNEPIQPKIEPNKPNFEIKPIMAKTYQFNLPQSKIETLPVKTIEKNVEPEITEEIFAKETVEQETTTPKTKHLGFFDESKDNLDEFITKTEARPRVERFKTNKLPPLSAKITASFEKIRNTFGFAQAISEPLTSPQIAVKSLNNEGIAVEEIDDIPALSVRFTAGLFDFLIGSFLSLILLSPFMLMGGQWFSVEGLFGFVATCAIVMFIYLTTSVGLLGKTIGMSIFQLEMVDIETNDVPSFHQSAVSASVYLLSVAIGGLGFLTVYLNSELRAAHDLLSNTIVVKEI
ncbi:MAG: RDD family protein [Pyrinomonadaceae bacterium]|jgi:uncharacterized RDD family membrane protein YckC|nr:RDD family protein [Pyrinomonadaceae bacterium]